MQTATKKIEVLLLEDSPSDARLITECFRIFPDREKYSLTLRPSLGEGLDELKKKQYDLVVTDLGLPDSNGIATVSGLIAATDLPIIVLTGVEDYDNSIKAMEIGAHDYLPKTSLSCESLRRVISYAIERHNSQLRYQALLNHSPDGILVLEPDGKVLFANAAAAEIYHSSPAELVKKGSILPADCHDLAEIRVPTGAWIQVRYAEIEWNRRQASLVTLRDITARKLMENRLSQIARYDSLTGLANRTHLVDSLEGMVSSARYTGRQFAVLMLDLDKFKCINDTMGHNAGDKLLMEVAARLSNVVRSNDLVSRTGGDEFVIIIDDIDDSGDIEKVAEKLFFQIAKPFNIDGKYVASSVSIGAAMYPGDGSNSDQLLINVDRAMYLSKKSGRNRLHLYDAGIHGSQKCQDTLAEELADAFESGQFTLYYQPRLFSGHISGMEALIRWRHPRNGLINPVDFLFLFERNGMTRDMERWSLRTACGQLAKWRERYGNSLMMSVNLSAMSLEDPFLPGEIGDVLRETGIPGSCLAVEINEGTLLKNIRQTKSNLSALEEMDVEITMDDFGAGNSSLGCLMEFPELTSLNIDREITGRMNISARNAMNMKAIVELGHALDMRVVAEGVETRDQLNTLREMGCMAYQGFLFSPAIPAEEWDDMISGFSKSLAELGIKNERCPPPSRRARLKAGGEGNKARR